MLFVVWCTMGWFQIPVSLAYDFSWSRENVVFILKYPQANLIVPDSFLEHKSLHLFSFKSFAILYGGSSVAQSRFDLESCLPVRAAPVL